MHKINSYLSCVHYIISDDAFDVNETEVFDELGSASPVPTAISEDKTTERSTCHSDMIMRSVSGMYT